MNVDFASLFKKKEKKVCDVKRGWVKISRVNNKSVFKLGNKTKKYYIRKTDNTDADKKQAIIVNATFDNLVERWQNERDDVGAPLLGLPGGGGCRSAYELRFSLRPIDGKAVLIEVFVLQPAHAAHFEKAFA